MMKLQSERWAECSGSCSECERWRIYSIVTLRCSGRRRQ